MNFFFKKTQQLGAVFLITSSLTLGSVGPSVMSLQKALNSDPQTRVATVGPGSLGQETQFFGPATRNAVIKFQNKYASEILFPVGLTAGNGYVGPYTLKKLNSLYGSGSTPAISVNYSQNNSTISQINPEDPYKVAPNEQVDIYATDKKVKAIQDDIMAKINAAVAARQAEAKIDYSLYSVADIAGVTLYGISLPQAVSGAKLTIAGSGFSTANNVYFGPNYIVRNVKVLAGSLQLAIPSLPPGKYDIVVRNSTGKISTSIPFVITPARHEPVVIDSVTPGKIRFGGQVTVKGSGFSAEGNEIITDLTKISGISSADGKTLTFTFAPESLRETAKLGTGQNPFPIGFGVISQNGVSDPSSFILSI